MEESVYCHLVKTEVKSSSIQIIKLTTNHSKVQQASMIKWADL